MWDYNLYNTKTKFFELTKLKKKNNVTVQINYENYWILLYVFINDVT